MRVIIDREKVEMATKLFVKPDLWNKEAERTVKSSDINDELSEIENEIRKVQRKILDDNRNLSARLVKQYYKGEKNFKVNFLAYCKSYVEEQDQFAKAEKKKRTTLKEVKSLVHT